MRQRHIIMPCVAFFSMIQAFFASLFFHMDTDNTTNDGSSIVAASVPPSDLPIDDDAASNDVFTASRVTEKKKKAKKASYRNLEDMTLTSMRRPLPFDMEDEKEFASTLNYDDPGVWYRRVAQTQLEMNIDRVFQARTKARGDPPARRRGRDIITDETVTGLIPDNDQWHAPPSRLFLRGPFRHSSGEFHVPHRKRTSHSSGRYHRRAAAASAAGEYGEVLLGQRLPEAADLSALYDDITAAIAHLRTHGGIGASRGIFYLLSDLAKLTAVLRARKLTPWSSSSKTTTKK